MGFSLAAILLGLVSHVMAAGLKPTDRQTQLLPFAHTSKREVSVQMAETEEVERKSSSTEDRKHACCEERLSPT